MKLALVSGAYPPEPDGIGDHTAHLARELARQHDVAVFTTRARTREDDGPVHVAGVFDAEVPRTVRELLPALSNWRPSRVIVQYNPFGFGPRGWNPYLAGVLRQLRRSGIEVDVFFHETHVPPHIGKFLLLFAFQYPQFAAACRAASRIFVSTERWIPQVRRARRDLVPRVVPIGSNIAAASESKETLRKKLGQSGTLLAVFGSAHPSRLLHWIAAAAGEVARRDAAARLVYIGGDGEAVRRACEGKISVIDRGFLSAVDAGEQLAACDLMLAPFIDGLSTRRGSVAAAFQNGLPVVSTRAVWTDELLCNRAEIGIHLSPLAGRLEGFARLADDVARRMEHFPREPLRTFYRNHFDWPVAAATLVGEPVVC